MTPPLTSRRILQDAYDWLSQDESRWCQNDYAEANGLSVSPLDADSTCLLGALARGARVNPIVFQTPLEDWDASLLFAVREVAWVIEPGNHFDCPHSIILTFNDREDTTYEDALLILKRALGNEEETD